VDELEGPRAPTLLVFSDDWGRHPSSCQHLIRQLLPRYRVRWVNTIGMRPPALDRATLARCMGKLRGWTGLGGKPQQLPPNLRVLGPKMWPWIRRKHDRWLNRVLLARQLAPIVRSGPSPVIAVTTIPIVADLVGRLPVARWVYYCVDDFSKWPGLEQAAIQRMEEQLVTRVDVAVAAGEHLRAGLARRGRSSHLLTHGVDLEFWQNSGQSAPLPAIEGLSRPLIVFWGLVDRRLDFEFIRRLSADLTQGTILLVGPEADPDPRLASLDRVVRLPAMPFEELPRLAREAAVLIMPYADLPVTQAMQPLKLKEYLATGKATVVRDLPANRSWSEALDLAATPEEFSAAVRQRLLDGVPESQRSARRRLKFETWAAKAEQFEELALKAARSNVGELIHAF
jgi:hypothetical protein